MLDGGDEDQVDPSEVLTDRHPACVPEFADSHEGPCVEAIGPRPQEESSQTQHQEGAGDGVPSWGVGSTHGTCQALESESRVPLTGRDLRSSPRPQAAQLDAAAVARCITALSRGTTAAGARAVRRRGGP